MVARVFSLLASALRLVASVIAALIIVHAVFVLFEANPANTLVTFTAGVGDSFGWFTQDLLPPSTPKFGEAIKHALAGVVYVVLGNLVSKLIVRVAPAPRARSSS